MAQPERKRNRFSAWDYRRTGPYFVTLCTYRREPIFAPEIAKLKVVEAIREAARRHGATVHAVCVAEEHVHLLLSLSEHSPVTLSQVIGAARVRVTQMLRAAKAAPTREGRVGASLLARLKRVGKPTPTRRETSEQRVWQRSFYDHIIRNDADFREKARHIENHPFKEVGTVFAEWH